ncbi:MAG TPA: ComF family protein [Bacteroidales bacterium]|jgi:ComF family protein|nr:ComF family protein [Bacteroidales bacterium]
MNYLYDLWDDFISLLFPLTCHGCGNPLMRNEYLICTECYIQIPRTGYHLKSDNPVSRLFWGRCLIDKAAAFSFYTRDSRIRRLIHQLKYKGVRELGPELGRIYGNNLKSSGFFDDIDLIVPVPLHPSKKRQRGYNQSDLISEGLSEVSGLPVNTELLVRTTCTKTQTKKSRYDRWTNVEDIFTVTDRAGISGSHILLVDDVITTGSTLEACANELLKSDNVRVSVVALAFSVL